MITTRHLFYSTHLRREQSRQGTVQNGLLERTLAEQATARPALSPNLRNGVVEGVGARSFSAHRQAVLAVAAAVASYRC